MRESERKDLFSKSEQSYIIYASNAKKKSKNNENRNIKINLRCYTQKRGKLQNKRLQQVEEKDS